MSLIINAILYLIATVAIFIILTCTVATLTLFMSPVMLEWVNALVATAGLEPCMIVFVMSWIIPAILMIMSKCIKID